MIQRHHKELKMTQYGLRKEERQRRIRNRRL